MTKLNNVVADAYQNLLKQIASSQVLLLHPDSRYRSVMVAKLINDSSLVTYYYAIEPDNTSLRSLLESMIRQFSSQNPLFGRHLNLLNPKVLDGIGEDFTKLLSTLAQEISELSVDPFILVLDEYDRSDASDDVHMLVEHLVNYLPKHCHLVINSRTMPRLPWLAMIAKHQSVILLDDMAVERDFYMTRRSGTIDLEVHALGQSYVVLGDRLIDTWEGHLPRLLFFFALDRPLVTRSEICTAFWPELRLEQAVNVFHVTKRRLHKALDKMVLVHNDNFYAVNPELNIYYDIADFVETLVQGRNPNNTNPFESWQKVVKLYKGSFLQGHEETWVKTRRAAFRDGYVEALSSMAQHWIVKDQKELAIRLYQQALEEDLEREHIHREVMGLFVDLGRRSEAVAHFRKLEQTFQAQKRPLEAETVAVFQAIANG